MTGLIPDRYRCLYLSPLVWYCPPDAATVSGAVSNCRYISDTTLTPNQADTKPKRPVQNLERLLFVQAMFLEWACVVNGLRIIKEKHKGEYPSNLPGCRRDTGLVNVKTYAFKAIVPSYALNGSPMVAQ